MVLAVREIVDADIVVGLAAQTGVYLFGHTACRYLLHLAGQYLKTASLSYLLKAEGCFFYYDIERGLSLRIIP